LGEPLKVFHPVRAKMGKGNTENAASLSRLSAEDIYFVIELASLAGKASNKQELTAEPVSQFGNQVFRVPTFVRFLYGHKTRLNTVFQITVQNDDVIHVR